jgi:hypothetical protein
MSNNSAVEATSNSPLSPNALVVETNDVGVPVTYACEYQTGKYPISNSSKLNIVTVEHFYDLVYNCSSSVSVQDAANIIAGQLLLDAANRWKILPNGEACTNPETEYGAWLFGVSSKGEHVTVSDFGCQLLTPDDALNECCQVIRSEMLFIPTGGYNVTALKIFVQDRLNASKSGLYRAASIEPVFVEDLPIHDDVGGNMNEPNRTNASGLQGTDAATQESPNNGNITVPGGFLIACLVAVVAGVFLVLYRRYRIDRHPLDVSGNTMEKDDDVCNSTMENGPSCEDNDFQVTVLNDHTYNSFPVQRFISNGSFITDPELDVFESQLEDSLPQRYAFDLGESFKNNVMGAYAPTTVPVVSPYPMVEDTSCDSEADDSWAQTDGTVGSIEERLEEITAEI